MKDEQITKTRKSKKGVSDFNELKETLEVIGEKIKKLRKEYNLTQKQFGEKIHVDGSFISRVERGTQKVSIETLLTISKTYSVGLDYFFVDKHKRKALENVWKNSKLLKEFVEFLGQLDSQDRKEALRLFQFLQRLFTSYLL